MKRIDQETVTKILDAADIVEVVSDYVKLRRAGSGYRGLCPFHNDRTPSFSVNRARNICKCFACGEGGSPVNFIMKIEQLGYQDALRFLARKYNIEIVEKELTDRERQLENDRESMLAANEFALKHFEQNLSDTDEGRDIGLAYFRHRGLSEATIKKFHLGYALDKNSDFYDTALRRGFQEKYLLETGLVSQGSHGIYDRFRGRVIFPIHSVSGRVVGFGARTLSSEKTIAKYLNSQESAIYVKNRELYGFYQAKSAISRNDKCIIVEGYLDVISMHQAGIEYVVASSGTALTEGHIRTVRRFTNNVTLIYDADAAGIKAALRGINLLLADNVDVRLLLLPPGEDPDSFAQNNSSSVVEQYIRDHETDFVTFMAEILLKDIPQDDAIRRSRGINAILDSIALVGEHVKRLLYLGQLSRITNIPENVLSQSLAPKLANRLESIEQERRRAHAQESIADITAKEEAQPVASAPVPAPNLPLQPFEEMLMKYAVRYGLLMLCQIDDGNGNLIQGTVLDYILSELRADNTVLTIPAYRKTLEALEEIRRGTWEQDRAVYDTGTALKNREQSIISGREEIRNQALSVSQTEIRDSELIARADENYYNQLRDYDIDYALRRLLSHPDDEIRATATALAAEKYTLSKIHSKFAHIETEAEQLLELVPRAVFEYKAAILAQKIENANRELKTVDPSDIVAYTAAMQNLLNLHEQKKSYADYLGKRIIIPISR